VQHSEFLARIIDDGIEAAQKDYADSPDKLTGAVAGFEACRGMSPLELISVLEFAALEVQQAFKDKSEDYWRIRCFQLEVEWVCNCVSAALVNNDVGPLRQDFPTNRGMQKAASILGVSGGTADL
jgi:hypothetical protein